MVEKAACLWFLAKICRECNDDDDDDTDDSDWGGEKRDKGR